MKEAQRLPGKVNPLLRVLALPVLGVFVGAILNNLDALSPVALLGVVFGNHEELTDVVLKR